VTRIARPAPSVTAVANEQKLDPVAVEIMWRRLITIMDEMDKTVKRTAFSTIIGESGDFACVLMDEQGRALAQSTFSTTLFTVTIPRTTRFCLRTIGVENLEDGDVLITNDPWQGAGHLPDVNVITPVFHGGSLIGFVGTCAHVPDIGGHRGYFNASEIFEEGLQIPPLKLYRRGEPNHDVFSFVERNVRVPELVIGDLRGIVSAGNVGSRRLKDFLSDYQLADLRSIASEVLGRSEEAVRAVLREVPDGTYQHEHTADGYAEPLFIKCRVVKDGDSLHVDLTGSSPQVKYGAVNCTMNATLGDVLVCMKSMLAPSIPNNEGQFAPLSVEAPLGSIFNCTYPASVQARSVSIVHLHDALYAALEPILPDRVHAGTSTFWAVHAAGTDETGKQYKTHLIPDGGMGGSAHKDGLDTIRFPGNGSMAPAEVFESKAPMLMRKKELAIDSAGAGRFRGGLGQHIVIEALEEVEITIRPNNAMFAAPGLAGGLPAPRGVYLIDGEKPPLAPVRVEPGGEVELRIPGGGGYGAPDQRDRQRVRKDLANGFISRQAAVDVYRLEDAAALHTTEADRTNAGAPRGRG